MALSKRSVETLLDLVEIKLGCMEVYDRDDVRERLALERCLEELTELRRTHRGRARSVRTRKVA